MCVRLGLCPYASLSFPLVLYSVAYHFLGPSLASSTFSEPYLIGPGVMKNFMLLENYRYINRRETDMWIGFCWVSSSGEGDECWGHLVPSG